MRRTFHRTRVMLGLTPKKPLALLAQATDIYQGLDDNKTTLFLDCDPPTPVLLAQIQEATAAQQLVGHIKGAAAERDAKFRILITSLESERMMLQGLCDASPERASSLIAAARMKSIPVPTCVKELLALKNGPSGTVLVEAYKRLLDSSRRKKTFNWRMTLDGGETFTDLPSTPVARTSVSGLTPLTMVGLQVSVSVYKRPQGPWSQTVSLLVL